MPMASGGGGSISRESITCTSARYPTANTTLITPVMIAVSCAPFTSSSSAAEMGAGV
eukprot:CAMPEP_0197595464 /NCGR_PEP_ID=MMETSP1326-20131121/22912_1 /TAXON_ID=1155430 /ORGANISM="Genus nov. species nov., Strain RCC2288" /LENGTH=56 /DNA_ID=CAMNT_0043161829 /DNA_START=202 /DNA_END=369 /DNA_ORIENTATION=-